jgi:hypothetical protein
MDYVRFFGKLEELGWRWSDDAIVAPNGTMYFDKSMPATWKATDFQDDMRSRLQRLESTKDIDPPAVESSLSDMRQVMEALGYALGTD